MTSQNPIGGLYAAVLIPRSPDGEMDERALRATVEFLLQRNVNRLVLNGATGEYCITSRDEFRRMLGIGREMLAPAGEFLACIGAADLRGTLSLAAVAEDEGASALLLPMPYFFPYEQVDLLSYGGTVARSVHSPVLLYNLPAFTTPLAAATVLTLVAGAPNIVGIKDSSGTLAILSALSAGTTSARRIVGNDGILVEALRQNVCDGVVSGVAGVLPELMRFLWDNRTSADTPQYREAVASLNELIAQLSAFPVPWGLKWIAEARGIACASFSLPLGEQRRCQGEALMRWFQGWWPPVSERLAEGVASGDSRV